ncbi:uncharacterized protein BXZ73DRAFT_46031 [Epithele typhae]|uniref:uncharacterized protein n=1 Tax=Epithele typhae TaxID=378194 RepID=UPI002007462D|nr:uncharacterized protein BXZ73DRAFT_46031 [Epithele typhae]KAH9934090.1 hypothetical protein BXZ73DRAFT_46031 [Epithele typhae]
MVDFPSSGPDIHIAPSPSALDLAQQRSTYLPFRRISLPSAPNLIHRQSIVSTASFDSLPEPRPLLGPVPVTPVVIRNAVHGPKSRPSTSQLDPVRRGVRRRESRVIDDQREAKRRKVITEFYETERSYLDGLELIHSHFLTPIIASLDGSQPLLTRAELTSIFSNFIDIWNLHRSFYAALTDFLNASADTRAHYAPPPLSPVLLAHFPYLSLYTPFVSSFSDALASYAALLRNNSAFSAFIAEKEADPKCGRLKFRDWLLTIVQRCPRYLLLLKDMISCTDQEDPEYQSLTAVHTLVSKITMSLNTSLHTHAQTLSLLALQRNTSNLPFQLISPGRTFLRRAPLLQLEGSSPREREFLLFSDCLIWLSSADGEGFSDKWAALSTSPTVDVFNLATGNDRPRSRTRSDVHHEADAMRRRQSILQLKLNGSPRKKRQASTGVDERWVYRGHVELVDIEVVVSTTCAGDGLEYGFDLLSPHRSFAVYGANEEERDEWVTAIRNAKASLLVSLSVMQLNSTLTSSASTNHLRRTLQALPYAPEDDTKPKRGRVEHFVPAVWVPDGKTESCMRCGRTFGWRRRRHHCRLCGRCVCGGCSGKTFFIVDSDKDSKSARACDSCYDTVFPLVEQPSEPHVIVTAGTMHGHFTLSGLKSMPCLLLAAEGGGVSHSASALMAIDLDRSFPRYDEDDELEPDGDAPLSPPAVPVRMKSAARPKSYIQILEDFQERAGSPTRSPRASRFSTHSVLDETHGVPDEREEDALAASMGGETLAASMGGETLEKEKEKENTARRNKRFSLPAVALQTNPVTARPAAQGRGHGHGSSMHNRFSLVLGKGDLAHSASHMRVRVESPKRHSIAAGRLSELLGRVGKD